MPILCLIIAVILVVADQITKYLAVTYLKPIGGMPLIDNLLNLSYHENTGVAFGMMRDQEGFFIFATAMTAVLCIGIIIVIFKYKHHNFLSMASATLILSGGIGNLIDRIGNGYVVDFIHMQFFNYIFNLADCFVVVGGVLFVIYFLLDSRNNKGLFSETEKESSDAK